MAVPQTFDEIMGQSRGVSVANKTPTPQAAGFVTPPMGGYGYNRMVVLPYDGEKDLGEMGVIKKYVIDHSALRMRSYQLYLESDVCHALFNRSTMWVVGSGLKLQAEPNTEVLEKFKIDLDSEEFNEDVEALFSVYANSKLADIKGVHTLHELASEGNLNSEIGGDVLAVIHMIDGCPKVEIIDGSHIKTPMDFGFNGITDVLNPATGNRVRQGIEIDANGKHVAYWVQKNISVNTLANFQRIPAKMDKYPYSDIAVLIYGDKYRIDNVRGVPIISAVMETAAKMGRYREAALSSAEERAKMPYSIEHEVNGTGENPIVNQLTRASGFGTYTGLPTDSLGAELANRVASTMNKMVFNMPLGAKMTTLESKQEVTFKEFYETNFDIVCAVAGYPPEVILSKYNSNYSASRAAIKDFEHTVMVKRKRIAKLYQLVYNYCLDYWVLSGAIEAPGYDVALLNRNQFALEAYRGARWAGDTIPHIDPMKEVQAWRLKLGNDKIPLCSVEEATEALSNNDAYSNMEQFAKEKDYAESLGLQTEELPKVSQQPIKEEDDDK